MIHCDIVAPLRWEKGDKIRPALQFPGDHLLQRIVSVPCSLLVVLYLQQVTLFHPFSFTCHMSSHMPITSQRAGETRVSTIKLANQ